MNPRTKDGVAVAAGDQTNQLQEWALADPESALNHALGRLESVQPSGDGWTALCPARDDKNPSLNVGWGEDGRILFHCHAGCTFEEILLNLDLKPADLFPGTNGDVGRGHVSPPKTVEQSNGSAPCLTLAQYAEGKRLPEDFLRHLGLSDVTVGCEAVRIPYVDEEGTEVAVRFRTALEGKIRFRWRTEEKAM